MISLVWADKKKKLTFLAFFNERNVPFGVFIFHIFALFGHIFLDFHPHKNDILCPKKSHKNPVPGNYIKVYHW